MLDFTEQIDLDVNGDIRSVEVRHHWTLLRVLRDVLGLTGTKRGCDRGECGACTVLLDGKPVYSCQMLALQAMGRSVAAVEALGTGILVLMIFALVDRRNTSLPVKWLAPVFIGLTVAMIISMMAPLTMGGWNPARDFGPRLVSFFAGWGEMAIPGPSGGFWAYIAGPLVGGPLGAAVYEFLIRPAFPPGEAKD